jgi:hypothetical protein
MKIWKHLTFIGTVAILVFIVALVACGGKDNEKTDPVLCQCPNGSLHILDETCCEGEDCICENDIIGVRIYGMPVTNRNNIIGFDEIIFKIEAALDLLSLERREKIKKYTKEIRFETEALVIDSFDKSNTLIKNNVIVINDDYDELSIKDGFEGISYFDYTFLLVFIFLLLLSSIGFFVAFGVDRLMNKIKKATGT